MEYLLENRKFTLILARDGNPDRIASPGFPKAWLQAEERLLMIAEKCHHLRPETVSHFLLGALLD